VLSPDKTNRRHLSRERISHPPGYGVVFAEVGFALGTADASSHLHPLRLDDFKQAARNFFYACLEAANHAHAPFRWLFAKVSVDGIAALTRQPGDPKPACWRSR